MSSVINIAEGPSSSLLETEMDIPSNLVEGITDSDLFKFFLNEDLSSFDSTSDYLIPTSSPNSSLSLEPSSSDSPQPSPPQLSPDGHELSSIISNQTVATNNVNTVPIIPASQSVRIKQEPALIRTNLMQVPTSSEPIDLNGKGKNSRKRDRPTELETQALSRDELLKISGKGIETFAQNIVSGKHLAPDDEKLLKRQKRLIKNRESAQLSRLRKKIYIEELERKVNHLTAETEALTKQVTQLSGDKKKLHEEVLYLQSIIKQSPELSEIANKRAVLPAKNVKAAGICLLIVLFSVGLLFNANQNNPNLPFGNRDREEIPEVLPKNLYTGRVLKSVPEEDITNIEVLPLSSEIRESSSKTSSVKSVVANTILEAAIVPSRDVKDKKHPRDEKTNDKQIESARRKKMKIADEEEVEPMAGEKTSLVPINEVRTMKQNAELVPRRDPNASYIYCPEAHHVAPATSNSGSEIVALLIPASVFNGSAIFGNQPLDSLLLEVSCSVLNLHMWPMNNITATQP